MLMWFFNIYMWRDVGHMMVYIFILLLCWRKIKFFLSQIVFFFLPCSVCVVCLLFVFDFCTKKMIHVDIDMKQMKHMRLYPHGKYVQSNKTKTKKKKTQNHEKKQQHINNTVFVHAWMLLIFCFFLEFTMLPDRFCFVLFCFVVVMVLLLILISMPFSPLQNNTR